MFGPIPVAVCRRFQCSAHAPLRCSTAPFPCPALLITPCRRQRSRGPPRRPLQTKKSTSTLPPLCAATERCTSWTAGEPKWLCFAPSALVFVLMPCCACAVLPVMRLLCPLPWLAGFPLLMDPTCVPAPCSKAAPINHGPCSPDRLLEESARVVSRGGTSRVAVCTHVWSSLLRSLQFKCRGSTRPKKLNRPLSKPLQAPFQCQPLLFNPVAGQDQLH